MGKAVRASVLILLLACSARAGYIPYGSPEPPPPGAATAGQTADGWIQNGEPESFTETVLSVLESVLSLL
jgi:hypothetical protein